MMVMQHNHYHHLCHYHLVITQAMMEVVTYDMMLNKVTDDDSVVDDDVVTKHRKTKEPKAVHGGHKRLSELSYTKDDDVTTKDDDVTTKDETKAEMTDKQLEMVTTKLYEELGCESLSDRRWLRRLCQFYKIQNDLTPSYLKEPIPQPRMFLYGQRRENVLHEIPCRTFRFLNSFYPDTIRSWNNIGYEFRNCSSLSKFKSKLLNLIRPPKK